MTDIQPTEPSAAPLQFGMLLYPGLTLLDLVGPQAVLGWHGQTHLVWKTLDPVLSDSGVAIRPTTTLADSPADLDVLFVPGGMGTVAVMQDADIVGFLRDRGARARYVTSVCWGSLLLAAAGLLRGYRATSHWAACEALAAMDVEVVHERVVIDRNRISGGGVTAGIDFGLVLLAQLRGETAAKMTQLMLEYDPKPPFECGTPASAGPALTDIVLGEIHELRLETMRIARAMGAP